MSYQLVEVRPGICELVFAAEKPKEVVSPAPKATEAAVSSSKKEEEEVSVVPSPFPSENIKVGHEYAYQRLVRDLAEIQENPLPTVNALPLENNFFEWHANLLGSSSTLFGGMVFHLIFNFPETYPLQPPKVKLMNFIDHPNVFGQYICLDMLEQGEYSSEAQRMKPYTGWTSAYSVQSILVQLQNFLSTHSYTDRIAREWGRKTAKKSIDNFSCIKECGHGVRTNRNIWPPIDQNEIDEIHKQRERWEMICKKEGRELCDDNETWWDSWMNWLAKWYEKKEKDRKAWERAHRKGRTFKVRQGTNQKDWEEEIPAGFYNGELLPFVPKRKKSKKAESTDTENVQNEESKDGEKAFDPMQPVILPDIIVKRRRGESLDSNKLGKVDASLRSARKSWSQKFKNHGYFPNLEEKETVGGGLVLELQVEAREGILSAWEEVYPAGVSQVLTDPTLEAKRKSGIPTKHLIQKNSRQMTKCIPLLHVKDSVNFSLSCPRFNTKMKMTYDFEDHYAKGKDWTLVCPDDSHPGNTFVADMYTNSFDIHYLKACRYYVHSSNVQKMFSSKPQSKAQEGTRNKNNQKNNKKDNKDNEKNKSEDKRPLPPDTSKPRTRKVYVAPPTQAFCLTSNFRTVPTAPSGGRRRNRRNRGRGRNKGKERDEDEAGPQPTISAKPTMNGHTKNPAPNGHDVDKQTPSGNTAMQRTSNNNNRRTNNRKSSRRIGWNNLPPEIHLHIFSFLGRKELLRASLVSESFEALALDSSFWVRQELFCYFSKKNFLEDTLGIGINIQYYPNPGKDGMLNIEGIDSPLDLLGYEAYEEKKVRRGAWKEKFTHFLPLYISYRHSIKALPLAEQAICNIMTNSPVGFQPIMAVKVLTKLMNTMIVKLMKCETWASEKALEGYFAFHHLLLVFVERYPSLLEFANTTIKNFIEDEKYRIKKVVPSLGEFIPLLAITDDYSWSDVAAPLIKEVFDRNQKWALKQFPALANTRSFSGPVDKYRILKTFQATQVSQRLIMFHVYFLNNLANPKGMKLKVVRDMYDSYFGRPTQKMKFALQKAVKDIQTVSNWIEYFVKIDFPLPHPETLTDWLKQSVHNSQKKRYHYRSDFEGATRNKKKKPKDDSQTDTADSYLDLY